MLIRICCHNWELLDSFKSNPKTEHGDDDLKVHQREQSWEGNKYKFDEWKASFQKLISTLLMTRCIVFETYTFHFVYFNRAGRTDTELTSSDENLNYSDAESLQAILWAKLKSDPSEYVLKEINDKSAGDKTLVGHCSSLCNQRNCKWKNDMEVCAMIY